VHQARLVDADDRGDAPEFPVDRSDREAGREPHAIGPRVAVVLREPQAAAGLARGHDARRAEQLEEAEAAEGQALPGAGRVTGAEELLILRVEEPLATLERDAQVFGVTIGDGVGFAADAADWIEASLSKKPLQGSALEARWRRHEGPPPEELDAPFASRPRSEYSSRRSPRRRHRSACVACCVMPPWRRPSTTWLLFARSTSCCSHGRTPSWSGTPRGF